MRVLAAAVAALLLAGCSSVTITPEMAQAAPARLQADMGPGGAARQMAMDMTMSMGMGDMSMRMAMGIVQDLYQQGAFQATVTVREFDVPSSAGVEAPDLEGATVRIFCAPDRLVVITEGLDGGAGGMEDTSVETGNTRGSCAISKPEEASDLMRLMAGMAGELGPMMSGMMTGLATPPDYEFVSLDGGVATYRLKDGSDSPMAGMPANVTATFDGEGRLAHVETLVSVPMMGMSMRAVADYEYGAREAVPDVRGAKQV